MPIERGKIREFATATKATHPDYDGAAAVIPPTFLTTAGLNWRPPDDSATDGIELALERTLHAEEEYTFHGPPPAAGQALHVTSRLGEQYEKEGKRGGTMRFVVVVNEYRDDQDVLVATQRTTIVETAKPPTTSTEGSPS